MSTSLPPNISANRLRLMGLAVGLLIVACAQERPAIPPPPVPADMSGFDAEIVELIRGAVGRLERDPTSPEDWRELGMLYHAHDQIDLAAECYRQSLTLLELGPPAESTPALARANYYLALAEQRAGNLEEAIAAMRRVIGFDASYGPARWRLGLWLLEEGTTAAALEVLQEALALDEDDPSVHYALGRAHLQAGAAAEAASVLEAWLDERPEDSYARFLLGTAYRRLGRAREAQRQLLLGDGAQPSWSDPWSEKIEVKQAGFAARLETATRLLDAAPEQAVAGLESLRREQPENGTVLINLGIGYRRLQRLEESEAVLAEAVDLEPARGLAHFHLAVTCSDAARRPQPSAAASNLMAEALEHAERAVELQPTSARSQALHGELLARSGQFEAAVASYTRAVKDPQDPAWLHRLGGLLCELGRWAEAVPVLENFIARVGPDAEGLFLLGVAQANSGDAAAARSRLEQALRARPGDARIQSALEQLDDLQP